MINFRFSAIYHLMSELNILIRTSNHNMEWILSAGISEAKALQSDKNVAALKDCRKSAVACSQLASSWLKSLNCIHIDAAAERLKDLGEDDDNRNGWSELNTRSRSTRDAIERELHGYYCYQYPKDKVKLILSWKDDWGKALGGFSRIQVDVFSAADCFALGHYTASVFHCMRVLEYGLGALARDVGLVFDLQQWNTIIEQIEAKITEARKSLPRGAEKNERMQFLSEAAKEFFYFKDGWRNHVSHNRGTYDEYQAASALEHTRSFMNYVATHLSE